MSATAGYVEALNQMLVKLLTRHKKGFFPNLSDINAYEVEMLTVPKKQSELKIKSKAYLEFCVWEGIERGSLIFSQTVLLITEEYPEVQFYINEESSEAPKVWCVDMYYPEKIYTFNKTDFFEISKFIMLQFKMRNL